MKKRVFGRHLSRDQGARRALFRSLVKALVTYGAIVTTKAKAKAIQPDLDKLVGLAKKKELSRIRRVSSYLGSDRRSLEVLFAKIAPTFSSRTSGFTRIVNLPERPGDRSKMVRLEWSQEISLSQSTKSKKKDNKNEGIKGKIVKKRTKSARKTLRVRK